MEKTYPKPIASQHNLTSCKTSRGSVLFPLGQRVEYRPDGVEAAFAGVAEYMTHDGWVGIRQEGGRLDEAKFQLVQPAR
jgi:hypothetical protein